MTRKNWFKLGFIAICLTLNINAFGQISDLGNLVKGGVGDAQTLFKSYLSPYANGLGANLNSGWYNTAETHSLLGFDFSMNFNGSFVPKADQTFDINSLKLQNLSLKSGDNSVVPTVAGKDAGGSTMELNANGQKLISFKTPNGTGIPYVPFATVKLGLGVGFNTDLMVRFIPKITIKKYGSLSMWGIGLKHDVKQWIPVVKDLPFLSLSVMGGFTQLNSSANLDYSAIDGLSMVMPDDQEMQLKVNSFTMNALASVKLSVLTLYTGVGMAKNNTNLKVLGTYVIPTGMNSNGTLQTETLTNPIDITMKNATNVRLNAGMRLKLALFTLHFDYVYCNYSVATMGLGFSFR